jgi:peptidoglycan-N-acetylglucosamine deacetylase
MGAARQLLRRALGMVLPPERFLLAGPTGAAQVALTFDDGPHPEWTPRLLDGLAAANVRATFFVVGAAAERHPALVERMHREGHLVGHHSWTHSEPATTSTATLAAEVDRCRALLSDLLGVPSDWFRPPKGQLTLAKLAMLLRRGQRIALWSADPRDYALSDAAPLAAWAAAQPPAPGAIVLLHDVHPHAVDALPSFLAWRDRGVDLVRLDAWFAGSRA